MERNAETLEERTEANFQELLADDGSLIEAITESLHRHSEILSAFRADDAAEFGILAKKRAHEYLRDVAEGLA